MLRIKEDRMKDLEKIGFEETYYFGDIVYCYDFKPYKNNEDNSFLVIRQNGKIEFGCIDLCHIKECVEFIYELIKADMVEKVETE